MAGGGWRGRASSRRYSDRQALKAEVAGHLCRGEVRHPSRSWRTCTWPQSVYPLVCVYFSVCLSKNHRISIPRPPTPPPHPRKGASGIDTPPRGTSEASRRRPEDCRMRRGIHHRHWNRLNSPFSRGAKILSKSICFHKTPLFFQSHRNQHSPNVHVA